jgi:hypothetical protein
VPLWHTGRCQSDTRHPIGGGHDAETHQADRRFALTVPGQEVARGDLLIEIALVLLGIAEPVRPNQIDGEATWSTSAASQPLTCSAPGVIVRFLMRSGARFLTTHYRAVDKKSPGIPAEA